MTVRSNFGSGMLAIFDVKMKIGMTPEGYEKAVNWQAEILYSVEFLGPFDEF